MGARVLGVAAVAVTLLTAGLLGGAAAPTSPAPPSGAPGPATPVTVRYRAPVPGAPDVVRPFDPPARPWAAGHRGVDLSLAVGEAVLAAGAGVVVFAGPVVDRPVVSVQHADGVRTTYEPVAAVVTPGEPVAAGQVLGHLAGPGHCAACLHWGARREGYLDPMSLLRSPVVRLLPAASGTG